MRDFVLDSQAELDKILTEIATPEAAALARQPGLFIRLALPKTGAAIDLSSKFGADFETAVAFCGQHAAVPGAWAWRFMSARNAWTRSPGAMPWRWPAR